MQAGGNAVDAAVATGFALAVVHPAAGNIGGGGFMLIRMADGKTHFLDYREKAPAAATRDMYLDAQGNVIEGASEYGYKAIGVPGSVAGMVYAEQKYGNVDAAAGDGASDPAGARWLSAEAGRKRATCMINTCASLPSHEGSSSAMAITMRRARFFASLTWPGRWSESPPNPTIFIMGRWRESWRPPCKRAAV